MKKLSRSIFALTFLMLALSAGALSAQAGWEGDSSFQKRELAAKTYEDGYRDGYNKSNLLPRLQVCGYQALAWAIASDFVTREESANDAYIRGYSAGFAAGNVSLPSSVSLCPRSDGEAAPNPSKRERPIYVSPRWR